MTRPRRRLLARVGASRYVRPMPSQLVTDVRRLIAERTEAGAPLSAIERTFLLSVIAPPRSRASVDVVEELEEAITYGRRVLLTDPPATAAPDVVAQRRREAATRLLAAARAALDFDPAREFDPATTDTDLPADPRPKRADVDG